MYVAWPFLGAVRLVVHEVVPTVESVGTVRVTGRLAQPARAVPVARLTNVTVALRMSPVNESKAGSPETALMSRMLAESLTLAVAVEAEAVWNDVLPVYAVRASSWPTVSVPPRYVNV